MIRSNQLPHLNGKPLATSASDAPPAHPPGAPWSMQDAATWLGISERHLIKLADDGAVRTIRLGRRRLVPAEELERVAREGTGGTK